MLYFIFRKLPLYRINSRPLDGEAVAVKTRIFQKEDVFLIAVVVIDYVSTGFDEAGGFHQFHGVIVTMNIIAFHLMSRRRGTSRKFSGNL